MSGTSDLSGPYKAAIFILGLEQEAAADVLKHLDEDELRKLAESIDNLGKVSAEKLNAVFEDFNNQVNIPMLAKNGRNYFRNLTASVLGSDKAHRVLNPSANKPPPLQILKSIRPQTLAELLREEHPQVAALVLSQMPNDHAARVLVSMGGDVQVDLLGRIALIKEVPQRSIAAASEALAKAVALDEGISSSDDDGKFDGIGFAAKMLNELPQGDTERLLGSLESVQAGLAPTIRRAMFTFEDLIRLPPRSIGLVMREVDQNALLVALKTASEQLRELFFNSVSSRAAAGLREELASLPPTRLTEVEQAQRQVVEKVMELAGNGTIQLPSNSSDKLV